MTYYRFLALEKRILFDASITAIISDAVAAPKQVDALPTDHPADQGITVSQPVGVDRPTAGDSGGDSSDHMAASPVKVLVVSSNVGDVNKLVSAASSDTKVVVYDSKHVTLDTLLQQIQSVLGSAKADNIGFVNEGEPGQFILAQNILVSEQSLTTDVGLRSFWNHVGALVNDHGRVDFLSCSFTQKDEGTLHLLDSLLEGGNPSHVINVAASTDRTGNAAEHGNWTLETGGINAAAVYFVSDQLDEWTGSLSTFTVTSTADSGAGTLRQAILDANANAGTDTINFNLPGSGLQVISPITALPTITGSLVIDGTSQSGYAGVPLVELLGAGASGSGTFAGLIITDGAANTTIIKGLSIAKFTTGIQTDGTDQVRNNYIGTDGTGATGTGNTSGVLLSGGNNQLTGNVIARNVTGANTNNSSSNSIINNFFGTDPTATQNLANTNISLQITGSNNSISNNVIKFSPLGLSIVGSSGNLATGNTISSNTGTGVVLGGNISTSNTLGGLGVGQANVIDHNNNGIQISNTSGIANVIGNTITSNSVQGIIISGATSVGYIASNTVTLNSGNGITFNVGSGSGTIVENNTIGQNGFGINIVGVGGEIIRNNFIGTDSTGTTNLANASFGVRIASSAANNTITGNLIKFNTSNGIDVSSGTGNVVKGNTILNNGGSGVNTSVAITVGGIILGEANEIAFNGAAGVFVSTASGTSIRGNSIHDNVTLGIDLSPTGVTNNDNLDPDTGANALQNFPIITSATYSSGSVLISGTLNSTASSTFTVDVYGNAVLESAGNGEGKTYLGSTSVTTDASGNGSWSLTVALQSDSVLTATATNSGSSTSEFSADFNSVIGVPDTYTTNEDTALTISAPGLFANDVAIGTLSLGTPNTNPTHGTLSLGSNGSFIYTPALNYNGTDSFTYRVINGASTSAATTVTLNIIAINDVPVAVDDNYSTNEDTALTVATLGVLSNDSDAETATPSLVASLVTGPAHGTLSFNANGSFNYTPTANYNGPDSFTYKVNDGALDSNIATVNLTISAVNDAPVAVGNSYTTNEDTALNIAAAGVLANDSDIDTPLAGLSAVLVSGPTNGVLTLNADGSFSYTPNSNYNGSDSFTYKVNDGALDSNIATVNLSITAVNDAPVAVNDSYSTNEDTTLNIPAAGVLANDSDVDTAAASLSAVLVSGPAHGTLTLNANGSFLYTPTLNYNGSDSFTYKVNDGALDSNVATVNLSITAVNDLMLQLLSMTASALTKTLLSTSLQQVYSLTIAI